MDKNPALFKWLWLVSCFGPGNKRLWDFIKFYDSVDSAFDSIAVKNIRSNLPLSEKEKKNAESVHENQVSELYNNCIRNGINMLCYSDYDYPGLLRNIYNPPAVLFFRGDMTCVNRELVLTVVGTRRPSDYSLKVVNALIRQLCAYDLTVISGFAVGIDIASHLAAVRGGGKTAAVLGCGLDYDYPVENIGYRNEIMQNGVFISEYFPGTKPSRITFPARNRILSGLSLGTIVIEAGAKSGSLITAELALQQGRDIFAVPPHNLFDTSYLGNAELLRDGALPIFGLQDILYEYYENYSHKLTNTKAYDNISLKNRKVLISSDVDVQMPDLTVIQQEDTGKTPGEMMENLSEQENIVAGVLMKSGKPMLPDEISLLCGLDITDTLGILTSLEIEGIVKPIAGNVYTSII